MFSEKNKIQYRCEEINQKFYDDLNEKKCKDEIIIFRALDKNFLMYYLNKKRKYKFLYDYGGVLIVREIVHKQYKYTLQGISGILNKIYIDNIPHLIYKNLCYRQIFFGNVFMYVI
jgi:hypothetical protein